MDKEMKEYFYHAKKMVESKEKSYCISDDLCNMFDNFYYGNDGYIVLCKKNISIESIYTDECYRVYIHVVDKEFEGDLLIDSLDNENQKRVLDLIERVVFP